MSDDLTAKQPVRGPEPDLGVSAGPDLIRQLAHAFDPPGDDYGASLQSLVTALAPVHSDAARLVSDFTDRVDGLTPSECRELFRQTFDRPSLDGERPGELLRRLSFVEADLQRQFVRRVVAPALDRVLRVLEPERNPFALLARAAHSIVAATE
jgi:hypothetical protein